MLSKANSMLQRLFIPNAQQPLATKAIAPIAPAQGMAKNQSTNPFMIAMDSENPQFMGYYGVNRPLKQPMFFGYRDNKPLYGGSRLFVLY